MNTEPWVTAEQVAQHLGVVKDTVYRWRECKGKITPLLSPPSRNPCYLLCVS